MFLILEPKSRFRIAFNMFDTDGNEKVDKKEFLVVRLFLYYIRHNALKAEFKIIISDKMFI